MARLMPLMAELMQSKTRKLWVAGNMANQELPCHRQQGEELVLDQQMPLANLQFLLDIVIRTQVLLVQVSVALEVIAIVDWELDQQIILVVVLLFSLQQRHPMLGV